MSLTQVVLILGDGGTSDAWVVDEKTFPFQRYNSGVPIVEEVFVKAVDLSRVISTGTTDDAYGQPQYWLSESNQIMHMDYFKAVNVVYTEVLDTAEHGRIELVRLVGEFLLDTGA